ncbi:MAG TPA: DUF397 domain-containing protein [Pseudonocardiaceae bacterium]|nr:DUF397 domain-containing protein [Pseudonocardiaceae bacterium]
MTHGPHRWRKSSYSNTGTTCVELAGDLDFIRDSKNPTGPRLQGDLTALVTEIKSGRFDR